MPKLLDPLAAVGKRPNSHTHRSSPLKTRLSAIAAALAASLAVGLGPFLDRESALRHAAAGMAARHGLAEAGLRNSLAAHAWDLGGWSALAIQHAAIIAGPVLLAFLLALLLLDRLPKTFQSASRWIFSAAAVLVFASGLWNAYATLRSGLREPRLLAPIELLARAERTDGRIFFDVPTLYHAAIFAPKKLAPAANLDQTARLSASTADWRAEDRSNPFSAAILTAPNAQASPLFRMLRTLPGWSLALADNHGFLFVRGNATLETASAEFDNPHDRAIYLAQAAIIQQTAGNPEIARPLLLNALKTDPKNPHVLVRSALFAAQEGRWRDTREEAEAALALDPSSIQADHLLALALLESGAISKAAARIEALAAKLPQDPTILSLQARIARENNDPATEIQALEKLLQLAKLQDSPTGQIHALLGQTWARRGFPDQALTHLQSALDSAPPADQRESLQENIDLIRQRTR